MLRHAPIADVTHHSLLIVEDALVHRTIISKIGDKVGFVTRSASSVEAAEALLRTQEFDAITLDLALGEHVGIDVLRLLADLKSRSPIIIISVSDDAVLEETCRIGRSLELDIWKPLRKPIDLRLLREMLEQIKLCSGPQKVARA
jgi:two-component system, chemotaxis family, chemotaxis protein CheY